MPRKYVKKTNYKAPDPNDLLEMLKAIKIDKKNVNAVSKQYEIPKDNLYRIVAAFDKKMGTDDVITEEKLQEFVYTRNTIGIKTVSKPYIFLCYIIEYIYNCNSFFCRFSQSNKKLL